MINKVNYILGDDGMLTIYLGYRVLAEISECKCESEKELEDLVEDVLLGMGYKWNMDGSVEELCQHYYA